MAIKRSPRYPRVNLSKTLDLVERLYKGAHQSRVDVDTAARVIGYSNSSSGAAAGAIGALRQFGLVDGLRGDMQVSDLAMRIIQPMDDRERLEAMREAAGRPEIFGSILGQFNGELPRSDEPIKAFLVRQQGFSQGGAEEVIATLRETMAGLPSVLPSVEDKEAKIPEDHQGQPRLSPISSAPSAMSEDAELIVLPLGSTCKAELRFVGEVTSTAYERLIRHLQLMRDMLVEDGNPN
jgi:hypothetical protein